MPPPLSSHLVLSALELAGLRDACHRSHAAWLYLGISTALLFWGQKAPSVLQVLPLCCPSELAEESFCAPAAAIKVSQLAYGALQTKNDTHYNVERSSETHGPQQPLVPFSREGQS